MIIIIIVMIQIIAIAIRMIIIVTMIISHRPALLRLDRPRSLTGNHDRVAVVVLNVCSCVL